MADGTYQPKTYRKSGGDVYVVASGGSITVESGGSITLEDGGQVKGPVTAASTASNISNYGITTLGTTGGQAKAFTIDDPVAMAVKYLVATGASSSQTVSTSTSATIGAALGTLTFNAAAEAVTLVGTSSTRWEILSNVGSVASS